MNKACLADVLPPEAIARELHRRSIVDAVTSQCWEKVTRLLDPSLATSTLDWDEVSLSRLSDDVEVRKMVQVKCTTKLLYDMLRENAARETFEPVLQCLKGIVWLDEDFAKEINHLDLILTIPVNLMEKTSSSRSTFSTLVMCKSRNLGGL